MTTTNALRCYCWTLNNYLAEEVLDIDGAVMAGDCSYICYGVEVAPNGTPHLQGYMEFDKSKRMAALKKIPGLQRAHFEARRGTQTEAITYCQKDGKFFEYGERKQERAGQNANLVQERLREVKKKIDEGATEDEIFDVDPVIAVRYDRWVDKQRNKRRPIRKEDIRVLIYYGKPGSGKTRRAYEMYPEIYSIPIGKDFWIDGYNGEEEVLIDDFSGNLALKDLLRLLDRYPILVPRKGSFCWWCPNVVIITTNIHPSDWFKYEDRKDSEQALKRRIHGILDFTETNPVTGQNFICKNVQEFW